ncbi:MAG TPA: hypothetical protein VGS21_00105, partial [Acidimicrobiales bacterium]|nr:hypothetical protein [Acidimicrobiales bacterium]
MCQSLTEIRAAAAAYGASFDPKRLSCADAARVAREAAAVEATMAAVKSMAAARAAESRDFVGAHATAAEALAGMTGTTKDEAEKVLQTGKLLAGQEEVGRAALAGEISKDQARLISGTVAIDPAASGSLLEEAKQGSFSGLKDA